MAADRRPHWYPAYIGLGSNLDKPSTQIESAFERLAKIRDTRLISTSPLYRSAPFGGVEQPDFVNAAAALLTQIPPHELLAELQRIEKEHGRERGGVRWGPRVLDLDLLVYAGQRIDTPDLVVPHPGIAERNFVLLPLGDIAPGLSIPGLGALRKLGGGFDEPAISRIA